MAGFGLGTAGDIRNAATSFGAAADALFAKQGHKLSAQGYREAAASSRKNESYIQQSTEIKMMQADRAITKTLGGQQADIAASGFALSGSALDIIADSMRESALTKELIDTQGDIDLNNAQAQTRAYDLQAMAAETAGKRSGLSTIINGVAGLASVAGFLPNVGGMFGGRNSDQGGGY